MGHDGCETDIIAVGEFTGDLKERLTRWKFLGRTADTGVLAELVAGVLRDRFATNAVDVVTWAPTSNRRRRERGYDQAEVLARAVARRLRLPSRHLLTRAPGSPQTGRSRKERIREAPRFRARPTLRGLRVVVIDDVVTTGSTLRSAKAALTEGGYRVVLLVAVAATPEIRSIE